MLTTEQRDAAEDRGTDAGRARASWVFDGNTPRGTYELFMRLNDEGDPELYDRFGPGSGWLSGENADGPTPTELAHEILGEDADNEWDADELATAYEDAAEKAYWAELEEVASRQLDD